MSTSQQLPTPPSSDNQTSPRTQRAQSFIGRTIQRRQLFHDLCGEHASFRRMEFNTRLDHADAQILNATVFGYEAGLRLQAHSRRLEELTQEFHEVTTAISDDVNSLLGHMERIAFQAGNADDILDPLLRFLPRLRTAIPPNWPRPADVPPAYDASSGTAHNPILIPDDPPRTVIHYLDDVIMFNRPGMVYCPFCQEVLPPHDLRDCRMDRLGM